MPLTAIVGGPTMGSLSIRLSAALLLLASGTITSADRGVEERSGRPGPARAIVVLDGLDIRGPGLSGAPAETLARAQCGDILLALGDDGRGRVRVQADGMAGWAFADGLIGLSDPAADARLLVAAFDLEKPVHWTDEPNYQAALALYSRHLELFPESRYRPLVLYRLGQVADRLAVETTKAVDRAESADPAGADEAQPRDLAGQLQAYRRWGLVLKRNHLGGQYYYGGEAYRALVANHPQSEYADEASYRLLQLERSGVGEWEGYPGGPLEELKHWQAFLERYPASEMRPAALVEMLYLQRVLYEIYLQSPTEELRDQGKSLEHRKAAEDLCRRLIREFPGEQYAARAETSLSELQRGQHVYIFGPPATTPPPGSLLGPSG